MTSRVTPYVRQHPLGTPMPNPASHPSAFLQWDAECHAAWLTAWRATKEAERVARNRITAAACRRAWVTRRAKADKLKEWRAGVAKIMAEVRRREAERALPEPPFYSSDNPLDGERLWS